MSTAACGKGHRRISPQSALESELVERIASMLWRLRRVARFEVALMASIENDTPSVDILIGGGGSAKTRLGCYVEFLDQDFSGKLMKSETSLQRQLFTVLDELCYLQELCDIARRLPCRGRFCRALSRRVVACQWFM